jgi:Protein of unknown function (DUF3306)
MTGEPFLSRWSRRKTASKAGAAGPTADAVPAKAGTQANLALDGVPAQAGTQADSALSIDAPPSAPAEPEPLPPVESLTPESDFAAFMKPEVDPSLKRQAFKKLIEDPRYNVMDGLDVYIDDYSKADPLPEGWLEKMKAVRYLGIFKEEAEEEAEKEPDGAKPEPAALPEAMAPEPVSFPEAPAPADTSSDQNPPPDVGKSGVLRGGN